jgi:aspartyl-tRNA(Asn)/glutamyl-tRNA(Gln) amidotransferase subunit A
MQNFGNGATHPADLDVLGAASQLRSGALSAVELLDACLERVDARNGGPPEADGHPASVNAWARIYEERAYRQARLADRRLAKEGGEAPLLCGVPMGLKDLFAVEGLPLTASSRVLDGNVAGSSSAAWRALESDGVILVGHTHTHEFAAGGSTDQVGNPWAPDRSAGGSSGGSAAALAAGMVPAALGTDTAGSLRIPAALCGISAFKPTLGGVPLDGVIPLAGSLDHAGPMARSLAGCAAVLAALMGAPRRATPWTPLSASGPALPLQASSAARPLSGRRIAVTGRSTRPGIDDDVLEGFERARLACEQLGATIIDLPAPAALDGADFDTILLAEARSYHRRHAGLADRYRDSTRAFLDPKAPRIYADDYIAAQGRRARVTGLWQEWFQLHGIDAVLEPTTACTASRRGHGYDLDQAVGDEDPMTLFTALWNVTGFPVAALPAGLGSRSGLPVGVSVIASRGREDLALEVGLALQAYALPPLGIAPIRMEENWKA